MKICTTERQRKAVRFIERILGIQYHGDLCCALTVRNFLDMYLSKAKNYSNFVDAYRKDKSMRYELFV